MKKYLINDFNFAEYPAVSDECPVWSAPFGLKLLDYIDYKYPKANRHVFAPCYSI